MQSIDPSQISRSLLEGPVFGTASGPQRVAFLRSLAHQRSQAGVELFSEGEPGDTLWIVNQGVVSLTHRTEAGESLEMDRAGEGDVFGEMAVISPALRAATARTMAECRLFVLTRSRFRQLLNERDACCEGLLRYVTLRICRRLRQTDARIALVHDALNGAPSAQLQVRVAELQHLGRYS